MRESMCQYGNCEETTSRDSRFKLTVTVYTRGVKQEQPTFCCYEHAWRWLRRQDEIINRKRSEFEDISR